MLGQAETVGPNADLFAIADKRNKLYTKKLTAVRADVEFAPGPAVARPAAPRSHDDRQIVRNVQNEANRVLLGRYAPPAVVVDEVMQIVQFRGQTGAYLEPAPGEASLNVLKMAREGLLSGLRTAMHEARKNNARVRRDGLRIRGDGSAREVNLEITPLRAPDGARHYLIVFEDVSAHGRGDGAKATPLAPVRRDRREENARIRHLEEELASSREYLQSIIQDLEATNEELQSANEEVLSSNEELQSTNEELDTAKEELQSTNEELNTVNEELHGRNEELSRVNSDLMNLLSSVHIPIVMVSGDQRIRRFTPMAEKILNLIPTDLGRPISDIKPNIDVPELERLISESIDTVSIRECEVRDRNGNTYLLRVRPYKNVENRIDGAVLALFDVSAERRHRDFAEAIVETVRHPLVVLNRDLRIQHVNDAFCRMFQLKTEQARDRLIYELEGGQWNIPQLRSLLEQVLPRDNRFEGFEVELDFPRIGRRMMVLNARRLQLSGGEDQLILLGMDEQRDKP